MENILENLKPGDYYLDPLPKYLSQFASRELISDILDGKIIATEDLNWENFGFNTVEDYAFWCNRLCGLVCTKMVIDTLSEKNTESIANLAKRAINLGGYITYDESGNFIDKGWYYAPLIELAKEYGLDGLVLDQIDCNKLCLNVVDNLFSIVSVHPKVIRFDIEKCPNNKKGGHLVLIVGFNWDGKKCLGFYLHNPSGRTVETQEATYVPIQRFDEAFAGRGFVLSKINKRKY